MSWLLSLLLIDGVKRKYLCDSYKDSHKGIEEFYGGGLSRLFDLLAED